MNKPKVLFLDIETAPILGFVWGLFDQNIAINQIHTDWHILSWAARWQGESKMHYMDQRNAKDLENEKVILEGIWKLLDESDIVVGHNSKSFDIKKLNARFLVHGMQPPSTFRQIDTLTIAKKYFAMTSNKLEYLADKLKCKLKKLKTKKFVGFELWKQCLAKNKEAFKEMQLYNMRDVEVLEEVYEKLIPWDKSINFSIFNDGKHICSCGSDKLIRKGINANNSGIFQRFKCSNCGKPYQTKINELSADKRKVMFK
jgi:uncharacterized protein YprB with RNaseH-like and TPR domain